MIKQVTNMKLFHLQKERLMANSRQCQGSTPWLPFGDGAMPQEN